MIDGLQWGRRRETTEGRTVSGSSASSTYPLQWGRRRETTEGDLCLNLPVALARGFNGAVVVRRRKGLGNCSSALDATGFNGAVVVRRRKVTG